MAPHDGLAAPYSITDLGTLGGARSSARALNDRGQVVGYAYDAARQAHICLWDHGRKSDLGSGWAWGISNRGQVVGFLSSNGHAFLWDEGAMTDLGTLQGDDYSEARLINERGQVVGSSWVYATQIHRAFFWQDGVMTDLGGLGGAETVAMALNERGQVVGVGHTSTGQTHGFLWDDGAMGDLGTLGGDNSTARAINNLGQVAGVAQDAAGAAHAVVWGRGTVTDLGPGTPLDINDNGQVVGRNGNGHGFLWRNGTMTDLGTLGGPTSFATRIDEGGRVTGFSTILTGETHGFLWQDGVMEDLGPIKGDYYYEVNNRGQIIGNLTTAAGETHACLLERQPSGPPATSPRRTASTEWTAANLDFRLGVAPNPFRTAVVMSVVAPRGVDLEAAVYDLTGRRVRLLRQSPATAGTARWVWDGKNEAGLEMSPGLYLVRASAGARSLTTKVFKLK